MAEEKAGEMEENFAQMLEDHEAARNSLEKGQKVSGKIIAISGDDVFLDLGLKEDGVMDIHDLPDKAEGGKAGPGDEVGGFITDISPQGIRIARSMSGAGVAVLEDAMAAGLPVEGRVKGACKGGYQVELLGKTAFCPGSQMQAGLSDEELVGKSLPFLVSRVENHGRNIVVSHRALAERERRENLEKLLAELKPGDIRDGKVARFAPFGAFIELAPGVEGLAHISELGWARVEKPEDVLALGDNVRVKILGMGEDDKKRLRISLSLKQAMEDPWNSAQEKFQNGDIVTGKVIRFAPFGAFVEIAPGIDGMVHLSEMSWEKRINKPEEALELSQEVQVKIKDINPESRRISLSLKDAAGDPWQGAPEQLPVGAKVKGRVESRAQHGLFISLLPGVTGLLPASVIKASPLAADLNKLQAGDEIEVVVSNIDPVARRISLAPLNPKAAERENDNSWKSHMRSGEGSREKGLMAQALEKAFKQKGDSK